MWTALWMGVAAAGPVVPAWGVPAGAAVTVSEEVVRTERAEARYLTRSTKVAQKWTITSGGFYRRDPLAWSALVVELKVSEDRDGVVHAWDLWSGRTADPELWRWVQRPEASEVTVDRVGVPAVSAQGGAPLDAAVAQRLDAELRGWFAPLPAQKLKLGQTVQNVAKAPGFLDVGAELAWTWTFDRVGDDGSAVLSWSASLAAPAAPADATQTVAGRGALSWDPRSGVVLRDEGQWSLRVQQGSEVRQVTVDRTFIGRVEGGESRR